MHVYRNKESLMSYMKSVEEHLQEARTHINNIKILRIYLFFCSACLHVFFGFQMKDHVVLSKRASSRNDFTLQLSRLSLIPSDLQRIMGNPETEACQRLVMHFLELHQLVCSKTSSQERAISSYESHIMALKSELQDACLRERNSCIPVRASGGKDVINAEF
uniref:Uncharacterized protein n=1 Tax=Sinocyclocheilus grahami TaxID=75366 RepID=A0A672K9P0_SINGR